MRTKYSFSLHLEIQRNCVECVVICTGSNKIDKLWTPSHEFNIHSICIRAVRSVESSCLVDCIVLHYFRLFSRLWWTHQLVSITSIMAASEPPMFRYFYGASNHSNDNIGLSTNDTVHQRLCTVQHCRCEFVIDIVCRIFGSDRIWITRHQHRKDTPWTKCKNHFAQRTKSKRDHENCAHKTIGRSGQETIIIQRK